MLVLDIIFVDLIVKKENIYRYYETLFSCFGPFGVWGVTPLASYICSFCYLQLQFHVHDNSFSTLEHWLQWFVWIPCLNKWIERASFKPACKYVQSQYKANPKHQLNLISLQIFVKAIEVLWSEVGDRVRLTIFYILPKLMWKKNGSHFYKPKAIAFSIKNWRWR